MKACERGEHESMDIIELWEKYYAELTGYLRKSTRNAETAEDIASQVYLQALKNKQLLDTMSPNQCRSWIYTSAKRMVIDMARRKERESRMMSVITPVTDAAEDDLTAVAVSEVIGMLPEDMQDLVAMRYFTGMDSAAIGKALGIPPATVRTRLRKACMLLRQYWNKE